MDNYHLVILTLTWDQRIKRYLYDFIVFSLFATALLLLSSGLIYAETGPTNTGQTELDASRRIYLTPEERREAGHRHEIFDWLILSTVAEFEMDFVREKLTNNQPSNDENFKNLTMQLGTEIKLTDRLMINLLFEAETEAQHSYMDEGLLEYNAEQWGMKAGRLYVPFGEYYSHFITGPLLEFGETRADALLMELTFAPGYDITMFGFKGNVNQQTATKDELDWGMTAEHSTNDGNLKIGLGFISDLSESSAQLLINYPSGYQEKVSAWNAYIFLAEQPFEYNAEFIIADRSFRESTNGLDQPAAYNLEMAYNYLPSLQLAIRFETSKELPDSPEYQYGVSMYWMIDDDISLSAEYLYGKFKPNFAFDDNNNELESRQIIALQYVIQF